MVEFLTLGLPTRPLGSMVKCKAARPPLLLGSVSAHARSSFCSGASASAMVPPESARGAIAEPREGTMLSVIRAYADALAEQPADRSLAEAGP